MELNWFAIFVIIFVSICVIYFKSFKYIDSFILFLPFNATVVFFTSSGTAVNLPFTLFLFSSIAFLLKMLLASNFKLKIKNLNVYSWLIIIAFVAIISQIMPYIIDGNYYVLERYKETVYWAKEVPLYPSIQWITQTLYFLIGILVVIIISYTYKTYNDIKIGLKYFFIGITFMIFWGWFGDITYFLKIPYPQLFNQIGMWKLGVGEEALKGFPRMASVTMEPSYFAQILIPITPFFYWFSQNKDPFIFSNKYFKVMYIVSLLSLLFAITTTGIIGFLILVGLFLLNNLRHFNLKSKYFLIISYSIISGVIIFYLIKYLVNVSNTYSGIERFKTVIYGFKYFKDYYILGLGWGVFPTYDLLINLLVNFGLIGFVPFLVLLYNVGIRLYIKVKTHTNSAKYFFKASFESFILILIVSQLSGFIYHSQYFWFYLGLAITVGSINNLDKINT